MSNERISTECLIPSKYLDVQGAQMHYLESGQGNPILFLHGVPTSSFVWRNIIPHLAKLGRCIAPDLIGFGKSDKPEIAYSITDHIDYVTAFIEQLDLKNITLVMHGWGSVVGLHYAMVHQDRVKGLVFYEAFLRNEGRQDLSLPYQEHLSIFSQDDALADLNSDGASFVDKILSQNIMRQLTATEKQAYLKSFQCEGAGKPVATYLRELPRGDNNGKVDRIIAEYSEKLQKSTIPKLLLYSVPGFITTIATAMWAKEHLPNLEITDIGEELHLAQESYPGLIGDTISAWMQAVEQQV